MSDGDDDDSVVVVIDDGDETSRSRFEPQQHDEYIVPKKHQLVTVMWHGPHPHGVEYRTGVLISNPAKGKIRFYNNEHGKSLSFRINDKISHSQKLFRARHRDLVPGSRCYDTKTNRKCVLRSIDISSGGVKVVYNDDEDTVQLISPDQLVVLGEEEEEDTTVNSSSAAKPNPSSSSSSCLPTATITSTPPPPPSRFSPNPADEYIKPKKGDLVSYLFTKTEETNHYRTGVLVAEEKGTIRFYNDPEIFPSGPRFYQKSFYLNEKFFISGHFRTRRDLAPDSRRYCYDYFSERWCNVTGIDSSLGAVKVRFIDNESDMSNNNINNNNKKPGQEVLLSADDLVAGPPLPLKPSTPHEQQQDEEEEEVVQQPAKRQKVGSHQAEERYGVHWDSKGRWYVRGKLRDDIPDLLVAGEKVSYSTTGYDAETKFLVWDSNAEVHVEAPLEQKEMCTEYAKQAEYEDAKGKILKQQKQKQNRRCQPRSASLEWRPFQPVYILGVGEAIILELADQNGLLKVQCTHSDEGQGKSPKDVRPEEIRLIGHKPDPIDLDEFFNVHNDIPVQRPSYREDPAYLLSAWRDANGPDRSAKYEREFEKLVNDRNLIRHRAGEPGTGATLSSQTSHRLKTRHRTLHERLKDDYDSPLYESLMSETDFENRINEICRIAPHPNFLLLCGGIAPEITAYKRLGAAPVGTVVLQDTDLHAVGVAVAAHPDVEFAIVCDSSKRYKPGDVKILSANREIVRSVLVKVGGIHNTSITNPCQPFSKAGKKDGFDAPNGRLLYDCITILRQIDSISEMPMYLCENVTSTTEIELQSDVYLPDCAAYFTACGSMCSPSMRKRRFATNRPPVICAQDGRDRRPGEEPPSLNGDLNEYSAQSVVAKNDSRMVHKNLKKFQCLLRSKGKGNYHNCFWEQSDPTKEPIRSEAPLTGDEAERALGYRESEIGVTAYSAEEAVRNRIKHHNFERDGCLVSLKGCGEDKDYPPVRVDESERLKLLGNSEVVTLLEALMWNDKRMFPAISH